MISSINLRAPWTGTLTLTNGTIRAEAHHAPSGDRLAATLTRHADGVLSERCDAPESHWWWRVNAARAEATISNGMLCLTFAMTRDGDGYALVETGWEARDFGRPCVQPDTGIRELCG